MAEEQKVVVEQDKKRLYIKWDVTGEQLKESFSKFGAVSEARVVPTGRIRPFAFITFESEESASKAMAAMQGKTLTTQPLTVEYASAGPRKEKKQRQPKKNGEAAASSSSSAPAQPKKQQQKKKEAAPKEAAPAAAAGEDAAKKEKKPRQRNNKKKDGAAAPAAEAKAE